MKIDAQLGQFDLEKVPAEAQRLERMGFDAVWSFESTHNPFLPLTIGALATSSLMVGTNIAVAFARSPMITATVAWDIQRASRGRFMLGLGTQVRAHNVRRLSAPSDSPAPRVNELIRCIRAIWDTFQNGSKPNFKGRFYQFSLITPFFNPGPIDHPQIPIYLAGVKPLMCRTAGEVADGFTVHPMHSVRYLNEVVRPNIDAGAKKRGKSVDDLTLFAPVFAVSGETESARLEKEAEICDQISFYAATPNYRDVMALHGWEAVAEKLSKLARSGDWDKMGRHITDEMLDVFSVCGAAAELPGIMRERYQGVVQRVSLYFPIPPDAPEGPWQTFTAGFKQSVA
ncbi:MAG: TIGR03617 family F420-dependent LLM class oxidoreductase [SAR324 cluster bacterium]|nr:TIGR03617 family F420-dependent LLM class oxidoreductase [SAR324 cluster bacterium]